MEAPITTYVLQTYRPAHSTTHHYTICRTSKNEYPPITQPQCIARKATTLQRKQKPLGINKAASLPLTAAGLQEENAIVICWIGYARSRTSLPQHTFLVSVFVVFADVDDGRECCQCARTACTRNRPGFPYARSFQSTSIEACIAFPHASRL